MVKVCRRVLSKMRAAILFIFGFWCIVGIMLLAFTFAAKPCNGQLYCSGNVCFSSAGCGPQCACIYPPGSSSGRCQAIR
jgi:hypothetical protein